MTTIIPVCWPAFRSFLWAEVTVMAVVADLAAEASAAEASAAAEAAAGSDGISKEYFLNTYWI